LRRDVFRYPGNSDLLVKVLKRTFIEKRNGQGAPWYNFKRLRHRYFRNLRRPHFDMYVSEIREQLAFAEAGLRHPYYLQRIVGFEETSKGLGLTVQAIKGRDGGLAPTVGALVRAGRLDLPLRTMLDEFFDELLRSPITISDLNIDNIVLGHSQELGDHYVVIDGYGTRTLIPLERLSEAAKRSAKQRQFAHFRKQLLRPPVPAALRARETGAFSEGKGVAAHTE
jgi:hypothetical protein